MRDIIIVDLETTGLDSEKHEIIEIGAVKINAGETFEVKIHPMRIKDADPKALQVNGYKKENWSEAFMPKLGLMLFNEFVGDNEPYFMSYNATFDWGFLQKAYADHKTKVPFHYHRLDLMTIAWDRLPDGAALSLKKVCEYLALSPEPSVHQALNGALCALEVYKKLKK